MRILNYMIVALIFILSACQPNKSAYLNQAASVTKQDQLPENPLQQKVISLSVNTTKDEMSILYGNDLAFEYAQLHNDGNYTNGSALYLVTWKQQDDPRWFGGKIPYTIRSVEVVRFEKNANDKIVPAYQLYEGQPLAEVINPDDADSRTKEIVSKRIAVIP